MVFIISRCPCVSSVGNREDRALGGCVRFLTPLQNTLVRKTCAVPAGARSVHRSVLSPHVQVLTPTHGLSRDRRETRASRVPRARGRAHDRRRLVVPTVKSTYGFIYLSKKISAREPPRPPRPAPAFPLLPFLLRLGRSIEFMTKYTVDTSLSTAFVCIYIYVIQWPEACGAFYGSNTWTAVSRIHGLRLYFCDVHAGFVRLLRSPHRVTADSQCSPTNLLESCRYRE